MMLRLTRALAQAEDPEPQGAIEQALRDLAKRSPDDAEAHYLLARALEQAGRVEEACAEYQHASSLQPNSNLFLFALADSKSRAGLHEEAVALMERLHEEGVGPGSLSYLQGLCSIRAGKPQPAVPLLVDAYEKGFVPGTCASLLCWVFGQSKETRKQRKHWANKAAHHGLQVKVVVEALGVE